MGISTIRNWRSLVSYTNPPIWAVFLIVFLVAFSCYVIGASRTIYVGDSGELVAAIHTMGIPHPPGYPIYVLLGKIWTVLVPIGSIAFRMSLFSAFFAALSCGLLWVVCSQLKLSRIASLVATFMFAFSPSFWSQSNIQRVYSLNAFFVLVGICLYLRWLSDGRLRSLMITFFVIALGGCNHPFMGIFGICIACHAAITEPKWFLNKRRIAFLSLSGLLGLAPWLYLPLRSRQQPRLDWGNPENLSQFWAVVSRKDFWGRAWMENASDLGAIVLDYIGGIQIEFHLLGLLLAFFAIRQLKPRIICLLLLLMVANLLAMAAHGSRSDIFIWHRYYIPTYLMTAILIASGIHWLSRHVWSKIAWLVMALPVVSLIQNWQSMDRHEFVLADHFSREVLNKLPPGSTLVASDDNILFSMIYLQMAEEVRPDVRLIMQGVGQSEIPPLVFNPKNEDVFFTHHPNWQIEGLQMVPVGLVFKASAKDTVVPDSLWSNRTRFDQNSDAVPDDYLAQNLLGHFHYMLGVTAEMTNWIQAEQQFQSAMKFAPNNDVLFYNLGLIYARNGLLQRSRTMFARSKEINARNITPSSKSNSTEMVMRLDILIEQQALKEQSLLENTRKGSLNAGQRYQVLSQTGDGEPLIARKNALLLEELRHGL